MSIVVFQHSKDAGPGRLGSILVEYGHRLRVVDLYHGDAVPTDLDDVDAVIVLGGRMNVSDTAAYPWLRDEMDFIAAAHARQLPVVGICFGSQLIATALGGEVRSMAAGPEIGWCDVRLSFAGTTDPVHTGLPWTSTQFEWHAQEITRLPAGATVLSSSDQCKVQAFRVGVRTYGFQYHFEVTEQMIASWAREHAEEREGSGLSAARLEAMTQRHYDTFDRLATRLSRSIADYVVPAVQRVLI